jgi:hypothetical protein
MPAIEERLGALHAHYTWRINAALARGRNDLARDLANDWHDEAVELIIALGGTSSAANHHMTETIELGGWPKSRVTGRDSGWLSRLWRHNS